MRKSPDHVAAAMLPMIRQNFATFLRFAFRELVGAEPFTPEWHLEAIEHQLLRMRAGENYQLIVTIPPRHLKSITISAAWVAWMLGREPQTRFNCVSHTEPLAKKHARDCLKIMESGWYRKAFPNVKLTKREVMDIETSAGGGRLSTSIDGGFTGRGGEWVIIDDPHKAEDAFSETMRKAVHDWFFNTARGRANTDQTRFIVLMQRLHEDDLAGHLLRMGGWEELRLASIATHDEKIALTRGRFHYRSEGVPITPGRQSLAYLRNREREQPYVFAAQNQQDPIARIGSFVDPAWLGTYDIEPMSGTTIMSCDTAVKTTVRSDWSVLIVARYYQGRWYILDVFRARVEFGELKDAVKSLCARYGVQQLLIEDAASGQSLIQQLRQEMLPHDPYPIRITPTRDKIQRFEAAAARISAGQLVLPRTAPWLGTFIEEITRFPGGRHDDQADALAHLLAHPPPQITPTLNAGPEFIGDIDYSEDRLGDDGYEDDGWGPRDY